MTRKLKLTSARKLAHTGAYIGALSWGLYWGLENQARLSELGNLSSFICLLPPSRGVLIILKLYNTQVKVCESIVTDRKTASVVFEEATQTKVKNSDFKNYIQVKVFFFHFSLDLAIDAIKNKSERYKNGQKILKLTLFQQIFCNTEVGSMTSSVASYD